MNAQTTIIKIDESTPLPCAIYDPITDGICGKPATAAYAYPAKIKPDGQWLVQPVCTDCARKSSAVYGNG